MLNNNKPAAGTSFGVDQYFLGISAPFGTLWAGKVAGVTDANVPGGSLDSVAGSGDFGLTGSRDGQIRYESPRINGLKLGISGVLNGANATGAAAGTDNPAGSLDEMNIMAHYELPIGLVMALGYETKDRVPGVLQTGLGNNPPAHAIISDKSSGFRFGATYSQDNWTVAYNYRKYDENPGGWASATFDVPGNGPDVDRRNSTTEYQGHRMAAKFVVDRVTMSANYSTETVSTDIPSAAFSTASDAVASAEVSRTTLGVDAKYSLGAKSWMALGHQNQDTESYTDESGRVEVKTGVSPRSVKVGTTTLRYGVSF